MPSFGGRPLKYRYIIADLHVRQLPTLEQSKQWFEGLLQRLEVFPVARQDHTFPGNSLAYTISYILAESHAAIHTAPEDGWVQIVLALCLEVSGRYLQKEVEEFFKPDGICIREFTTESPGYGVNKFVRS